MRIKYIKSTIFILITTIFLSACAVPYKIMPGYWQDEDQIQTIAFYPLLYKEAGHEQRLFGMFFSSMFFPSATNLDMIRPLKFIMPDSTVAILESAEILIGSKKDDIKDVAGTALCYYRRLSQRELEKISDKFDAIIFCDLLKYNEVGAGEQLAQACASSILTMGMVTVHEKNLINMRISMVSTYTGEEFWSYNANFSGGYGEPRSRFSRNILNGFRRYFPLSQEFRTKEMSGRTGCLSL